MFYCFIYFSHALPSEEYVNLTYSIILLWSYGNISSPVRYLYLSILPDDNVIFAASLLILYYISSSIILSSVVMISFYILYKRIFLKCKEWSDTRVV